LTTAASAAFLGGTMNTPISEPVAVHGNHDDADYGAFLASVKAGFLANLEEDRTPLFTTDAEGLFAAYLDAFDTPARRQYNHCHVCSRFVVRFGALVTIDAQGKTAPALWHEDQMPEAYKPAIAAMTLLLQEARVTGVFLASELVWGRPETGPWRHLAITPPQALVFKRATQSADQAMAEKREDFKTVMYALNEFTLPVIEQALTLLRTEVLYRSEKVLGQAEWLHALHLARHAAQGSSAKANVVWRAVALAPAGFCHPRSSMIGTLLEDIAAGLAFEDVSRRFADKMHPLQYQRPQAAPTAGAIAAAEKLMQQLDAAGALARRFARLDEVQALWKPQPLPNKSVTDGVFGQLKKGVFDHLKPKGAARAGGGMKLPVQVMTWEKFQRTVLPGAQRIEFCAPERGSYSALVTAVHANAPPILQWDREDRRNPVSWYLWHGGSTAAEFGLRAGDFHPVTAITLKPSMWNGGHAHQGQGVMFIIEGAKDSRKPEACLFPEILKAEFHGVRSVLEAYSKSAKMEGAEQASAAGVMLHHGESWDALVRVWADGRSLDYQLDRWD
jgi:hypothetical protein